MNRKKVNGFTLIELIVVITIIGVLAAILIPMFSGYIKKSYKKSDVSAGGTIGKAAFTIVEEKDDFYDSFYSANPKSYSVTAVSGGEKETYDFNVVCKSNSSCTKWVPEASGAQLFCDEMNTGDYIAKLGKVKYAGPKHVKIWVIGYRDDDIAQIEVWTAEGIGGRGSQPVYRVWPSPDGEYA